MSPLPTKLPTQAYTNLVATFPASEFHSCTTLESDVLTPRDSARRAISVLEKLRAEAVPVQGNLGKDRYRALGFSFSSERSKVEPHVENDVESSCEMTLENDQQISSSTKDCLPYDRSLPFSIIVGYRHHEGTTNAIRRPVKMQDVLAMFSS